MGARGGFLHVAVRNWILVLILGALAGSWFVGDAGGGISQRQIQPVLPGFDASRARSIVLERADLAAVETGGLERTTLTRRTSVETTGDVGAPDVWTIAELHGTAAFADRVDDLLSRIGSMTTLDLVSEEPGSHAGYGLTKAKALQLRVSEQERMGDSPMVDLLIAPAPGRAAYVLAAGDDRVWRIARFTPPSASPRAWFDDSSLMPLPDRGISAIRASGPALEGEPVIVRTYPGGDRYTSATGETLVTQAVLDLFKRLRTLFPTDVVAEKVAGEPLDGEPWFSIEVEPIVGGNDFRIDFARPEESPEGGARFVRAARLQGTITVTVSAATVEKLVESLQRLRE
ncbi:hypothetical protein Poly30_23710 [Planctomycetes bacterium Poly30]|uniref:DUF4340 domain-containing protein n=2 Tax=Saltatorellus ferox TaxID=2528018 RepID=A0A518ERY7_9BACT|nr:hypothetical protein Poly30_23710 [Planctomycetes bacterium Poly30]